MGSGHDPVGWFFRLLDGRGLLLAVLAFVALGFVAVFVLPAAARWLIGNPAEAGGAGLLGTAATVEAVRRRSKRRRAAHRAEAAAEAVRIEDAAARAAERRAEASEPPDLREDPPADEEARRARLRDLGRWDG